MFIGSCVEYCVYVMFFYHLSHPCAVCYVGNAIDNICRCLNMLLLQIEQRCLGLVEANKFRGRILEQLLGELGANRASGSRHHDHTPIDPPPDRIQVELHWLSAEQVLQIHFAQLIETYCSVNKVCQARNCAKPKISLSTVLSDSSHLLSGR